MSITTQTVKVKAAARKTYQKRITKLVDYYEGNQIPYLKKLLDDQFKHPENLKQQPEVANIVKPIIKQSAKVFQEGVRVNFEDENQEEVWNMAAPDFQMSLVTIDRYVRLLETVPVKVSLRRGRIHLDIITPNGMIIRQRRDDYLEADKVSYTRDLVDTTDPSRQETQVHHWTANEYWMTTTDGKTLKLPSGQKRSPNNYGMIPFVFFREEKPLSTFWNWPDDTLVSAQDNINLKLTELNYLLKMQSFSIPVTIDYEIMGDQYVDPSEVLKIETRRSEKADFKFVTPEPKIEAILKVIGEAFVRAAWEYGINPQQFSLQQDVKSGFALKMENVVLMDDIKNRKNIFTPLLSDLYQVIRAVWNYHTQYSEDMLPDLLGRPLTEIPKFDIRELRQDLSPNEEQQTWQFYFDNNLRDKADYEMYKNPDLTRAEAIDLVKQREADIQANPEIKPGVQPQSQIVSGMFE